MRIMQAVITTTLLLLMLLVPQLALADGPDYSISLVPYSGVYDDLIEVRGSVEESGTYYICWGDSPSQATRLTHISADAAGNFSAEFNVPEAKRGKHKVCLTNDEYGKLAEADFEVFPTARIDPDRGPVGTEVDIWGYGFTAQQSVEIRYRDQVVKTVKADSIGSWETSHTIPASPTGSHYFCVPVEEIPELEVCCNMRFRVTPAISVEPEEGTVGEMVEVEGTGFARNEKGIEVAFDGEVVKKGIPADENGSWSAEIAIPARRSGTYTIDASGISTRAGDVPDVEFKIVTGVAVQPTSARVGETITVTGGGFAPREGGIRVTFDGTAVTPVITADIDGSWESSFVLPTSTSGSHTVSASGNITKAADVRKATLSTLAKIEVSPVEGTPGESVSLTGSGFPANQTLTVTFANRSVQEDVRTLGNGNVSTIVTVPASPVGSLLVTATSGWTQASAYFTVKAKVLETPQPFSPEEDSTLRSGRVTFTWGRITGGSDIAYNLEIIGLDGSHKISGIEGLSYQLTREEALPGGEYSWRVKAVDEFGNESPWSSSRPFTVSPIPIWVWVIVGVAVLTILMVVAYREAKFKVPV